MARVTLFSERHGHRQSRNKEILYREDIPLELRFPIVDMLVRYADADFLWKRITALFNPYGIEPWPAIKIPLAMDREDTDELAAVKRNLLGCEWFRLFDVIEDIYQRLEDYDNNHRLPYSEDERAQPLQEDLNRYFEYVGIGWKLENGQFVARSDDNFEKTITTSEAELKAGQRLSAAERIKNMRDCLSKRPQPDLNGAVSHATGAMECVLHDITGDEKTLGGYISEYPNLFPGSVKKMVEGAWGYACNEGPRHGKEGIEPKRDEAELVLSLCAAVVTFLNRKHPRDRK